MKSKFTELKLDCVNVLILINVLVFIAMVSMTGARALIVPDSEALFRWGANIGAFTIQGQYWRLFTSMFIHASIIHLGLNMWALHMFGPDVLSILGTKRFLSVYFLSGLCGALCSIMWNPTQTSSGASGAIIGLAGAMLSSLLCGKKSEYSHVQPVIFLGVICASLLGGFFYPEIDNAAHVGGFFAGFVAGLLVMPFSDEARIFKFCKFAVLAVISFMFFSFSDQTAKADKRGDVYRIDAEGMADLHAKKYAEAYFVFDRLLKTEINSKFFIGRAAALIGLKRFKQALDDCNKGIAADRHDMKAFLSRARVFHELGEFQDAVNDYSFVIKNEPREAMHYNARAWSEIPLGQYDNALRDINKSLELAPNVPEALDTRGLVFFCLQDYHKAMLDYEKSIQLKPKEGASHYHLAMMYLQCGENKRASEEFKIAEDLKYAPDSWEVQMSKQMQKTASTER